MPGSIVDDEHDPRMLAGGIGPGDVPHVARKGRWHTALPGRGLSPWRIGFAALDEARGELASHQVERAEHVDQVMTVQMTDDGPMPFEPQGRASGGNHGEPCLIVTQQDEFPLLGFC